MAAKFGELTQKKSLTPEIKTQPKKYISTFCKYYLGVNSKVSNFACRAELGRFPYKIFIDKLVLRYYNHLLDLPDSSLQNRVFSSQKTGMFIRRNVIIQIYMTFFIFII